MMEMENFQNDESIEEIITKSMDKTDKLFSNMKDIYYIDDIDSKKTHIYSIYRSDYLKIPSLDQKCLGLKLNQDKDSSSNEIKEEKIKKIKEHTESTESTEKKQDTSFIPKSTTLVDEIIEKSEENKINKKRKQNFFDTDQANEQSSRSTTLVKYKKKEALAVRFGEQSLVAIGRRRVDVTKPQWHAPWKLKRVISGHLGWVRSIAIDPTNEWFVTGAADRCIKIWDLVTGQLKLTLTGHINTIRGLAVSERHPYLFSAGEDKKVLCWDLEYNKVIRSYHGHLSGVYSLKLHPTLDILVTGGRDSVARVWDMRTKSQIHCLGGHGNTVSAIETQATDPQIFTGSMDSTIKLWDLAAGKVITTLTNHKKAVRALYLHPKEHTFLSGAADNLKKWHAGDGTFLKNFSGHNSIVNTVTGNVDNVVASGADNGSIHFWDYTTGYCFQKTETIVQPGSLDSEAGIYASAFDMTGMRLITCEADKTIKIWHEDEQATEESHPIDMKTWTKQCLAPKRY